MANKLYILFELGADGFLNDFILVVATSQEEAEKLIGDRSEWSYTAKVEEFNPDDFEVQILYDMHEDEEE